MMIQFEALNIAFPPIDEKKTIDWIREVCHSHYKKTGQVHYIFCDDEKILEVNRQYLDHDYYTDIITFDYSENNIISGDIFISLDTVKSNADEIKENFEDELRRIIIHGILHLCGQNDKTPDDKAEMTRLENEALKIWLTYN